MGTRRTSRRARGRACEPKKGGGQPGTRLSWRDARLRAVACEVGHTSSSTEDHGLLSCARRGAVIYL